MPLARGVILSRCLTQTLETPAAPAADDEVTPRRSRRRVPADVVVIDIARGRGKQNALIYDVVRHIHIANRTGSAATFSLYVGATGGSAATAGAR